MNQRELAEEYGVARETISRRACRERWHQPRQVRRRAAETRRCLTDAIRQLQHAVSAAAERLEDGDAEVKELKELAAVLQTLAGLEKVLEPQQPEKRRRGSTVRVVLSQEAEELSR